MTLSAAIILCIFGPLLAAGLAWLLPRRGFGLGLLTVGLMVWALTQLVPAVQTDRVILHRVGGWGAPLGIDLRADGLAVLMLGVTAIVGFAVTLYAHGYFMPHQREVLSASPVPAGHPSLAALSAAAMDSADHSARYFWPLFLFLWGALNALFLSADLFNLYVTLELLGLAAVALVALDGKRAALLAAMRYLLVGLSASMLYLLGVALVYGECGSVDLAVVASRAQPGPVLWVAFTLMAIGLIAKTALFPLHFWLPPAHANTPAPVSALLSALVVKGAFYLLLRLGFEAFAVLLTPGVTRLLGVLGATAIVWGSVNALVQPRLKLLIAYSTVAQLGYLFLMIPLATSREGGALAWGGGWIFLAAHACAKTAMFLIAGNILHAAGHDRIRDLNGITHAMPISASGFGLAGLSLIGLPPSSGFAGKWLLLSACLAQAQWAWVGVLLLGSLLAAAYIMRVLTHAFTRTSNSPALHRVPPLMEWTALGMAALAVALGFAASWSMDLLQFGMPAAVGGLAP